MRYYEIDPICEKYWLSIEDFERSDYFSEKLFNDQLLIYHFFKPLIVRYAPSYINVDIPTLNEDRIKEYSLNIWFDSVLFYKKYNKFKTCYFTILHFPYEPKQVYRLLFNGIDTSDHNKVIVVTDNDKWLQECQECIINYLNF